MSRKEPPPTLPMFVRKRTGQMAPFDADRISRAVSAALTETGEAGSEAAVAGDVITELARQVSGRDESVVAVEEVQDIVERALMKAGLHATAKAYILYRQRQAEKRTHTTATVEDAEAFQQAREMFPTDLQMFQALDKYARWQDELGRRETWPETVDRTIGFLQRHVLTVASKRAIPDEVWQELREAILRFEVMPSMRLLQMAGPALERDHLGAYNCSYLEIRGLRDFAEILYILMQGTGVGYSVETECIEDLPKIRKQKKATEITTHVVADSTEGWCDSLLVGLEAWFGGTDVKFDYSQVRPAGAVLKTKGGRASGPGPLRELHEFCRRLILSRQGKRLRTIDANDIACKVGHIVQVGGVRRAACICLSDLDDELMRSAKSGAYWDRNPQRAMANISTVYEERPDDMTFLGEWMALIQSGSGERGIFNREAAKSRSPKRRKKRSFGCNPCAEIYLRPRGLCNLSMAIIRPHDTVDDLHRKARLAAILGTIQSTLTKFNYVHDEWRANAEEERLLGVDLAGASDNPLTHPKTDREGRRNLLTSLRDRVVETNKEFADRLNIAQAAATTCIKPGGNSSVLLGIGNSITGWHSRYTKRHVRVSATNPMARFLIDAGVPYWPEVGEKDPINPQTWVFAFPREAPEGALIKDELTAIDQLENWLDFKESFAENNPSVTVYIKPNEWVAVGHWILEHWDCVGGLAFLPADGGVYQLAPNEEMMKEGYDAFVASFPKIPWEKFPRYEMTDHTTVARDYACTSGACEI